MRWASNTNFRLIHFLTHKKFIFTWCLQRESAQNTYILIKIIKFGWNNYGGKNEKFLQREMCLDDFLVREKNN